MDDSIDDEEGSTWDFAERAEIVPGYYAWDLLGIGRRFEMWIAWCADRLTPVCVKIPRSDEQTDRTIDALRRELEAASAFDHPGIPRVFASDLSADLPFVVYEYIEGKPLSHVIETDGPSTANDVVLIGLQVAAALRHMHARGFVHLDLKPSNIALRGDRVVVLDFDITLPIGVQRSRSKPRGTRWYMPPEQIRCEPAHPSMDVFALGAVLYEAATATIAFGVTTSTSRTTSAADGERSGAYRQLGPPIPPVIDLAPGLWPALCKAIDSFLELDPAQRPASASEAIEHLVSALPPGAEALWPDWVNGLVRGGTR